MSRTRYLEIDSKYRDRVRFPSSGEFEVPISQTGRKGSLDALDPVSLATPIIAWISNNFNQNIANSATVTFTPITTGSRTILAKEDVYGDLSRDPGYYVGSVVITATRPLVITKWEPITQGVGGADLLSVKVTFNNLYEEAIGTSETITDSTDVTLQPTDPLFFIPKGSDEDNAYVNYVLVNETLNESRSILFYDGTNHVATIDTTNGGNVVWLNTHTYSIRKQLPQLCGSTFEDPTIGGGPASGTTFLLNGISFPQQSANSFIQLNNSTQLPPDIQKIIKYSNVNSTATSGTLNTMTFPLLSRRDGTFTNLYVRITGGTSSPNTRLITNHVINTINGITISETITVTPNFTLAPDNTSVFEINSGTVEGEFSSAPGAISNNDFCYLPFSFDNLNPFSYTGCISESYEMTCYEIELINLILPNQLIWAATGGKISSYPYLYVSLCNVSSPGSGNTNILYSNNPNSTKMLFRVQVDDYIDLLTPYIKLDGSGAKQTIKFKPRDTLRFGVYFGNGEVFNTIVDENFSPSEPNDNTQISALFGIKRIL